VTWLDGAYSLWSSDGQNGGNTWVPAVRLPVVETGDVITLGETGTWYPSQTSAEAIVVGSTTTLELLAESEIVFYQPDGGGCGDNAASSCCPSPRSRSRPKRRPGAR